MFAVLWLSLGSCLLKVNVIMAEGATADTKPSIHGAPDHKRSLLNVGNPLDKAQRGWNPLNEVQSDGNPQNEALSKGIPLNEALKESVAWKAPIPLAGERRDEDGTKDSVLPVISRGDVLYYDISQVGSTELVIPANDAAVEGITAVRGRCQVRTLLVTGPYLLDEALATHCHLQNLTLQGNWSCHEASRWGPGVTTVAIMRRAKCADAWYKFLFARRYSMAAGIKKLEESNISCASHSCKCRWYFSGKTYTVSVECEERGLTDATVPHIPDKTISLNLNNNSMQSMNKLMEHLKSHQDTLEVLYVENNEMVELPRLVQGSFPHIIDISLKGNKIKKIDLEVFASLVKRDQLMLSLQNNPFPCDCDTYRFKELLYKYCKEGKPVCIYQYKEMTCITEDGNDTVPFYKLDGKGCAWGWSIDPWLVLYITLGALNIIFIYFILDLFLILTRGDSKTPKMHYLVCLLCGDDQRRNARRTSDDSY